MEYFELSNGVKIPALGIGTFLLAPDAAEKAVEILRRNEIDAYYGELAPVIINRRGDGPCPMEIAVADTDDPEEAYSAVKACLLRLSEKNISKKRTSLDPTA